MSYFEERLQKLGITKEINQVKLWRNADQKGEDGVTRSGKELRDEPIFRKHEKGIEIIVYNLAREQPTFTGEGQRWKKNWSIVRLENPIVKPDGNSIKYLMPKGQGSFPFFPPALIDKFDNKEPLQTLYLTEGFFKAMKGSLHGIDIVGVPSITHLKDKETGALHPDILTLINTCNIQRLVWLIDGDCIDISTKALDKKEEIDLRNRPASFIASITTFKQLLDDYPVDKYMMHIDTDNIFNELKPADRNQVKGLDDIMTTFPEKVDEIVQDIKSVSKPGFWFHKTNITAGGMSKVWSHFRLNDVNSFILFHQERLPALKGREFIFNGTRYKYNDEKGECDVIIPGAAQLYFRVGNDYYKWLTIPNQYGNKEKVFHERSKATIVDDHNKFFIKYVAKYEAFCNVPDHINHQLIIDNCFNVYNKLDIMPDENDCTAEDFPTITTFLLHVFGDKEVSFTNPETKEKKRYKTIDLAIDYFQLLYQKPTQKLPILCLVSRENNTGKSTVANFLRLMLGANVAIVGNADLISDFNAHWATKNVVICDETKIDKQHVIEKIKSLSTARKIWVNAKGRGQIELDCFLKFVLISNNEDNFIYAGDEDIRYWVHKVPVLTNKENPTILEQFLEEMPAFLSYLSKRKIVTEYRNRMWFHPDLIKTDALKKVIEQSMPAIEKELRLILKDLFIDTGADEIKLTRKVIREELLNKRFEETYIDSILKSKFKVEPYHVWLVDKEEFKTLTEAETFCLQTGNRTIPAKKHKTLYFKYPKWIEEFNGEERERKIVLTQDNGRPYVFERSNFLNQEEIAVFNEKGANSEIPFP